MKWTKQQQVLGGVMLVGLIAVGVDRLMPKAVAADASAEANDLLVDHSTASAPATAATAWKSATHLFNQRLAASVSESASERGAFEAGKAWQTAAPVVAVVDPAIEQFVAAHRLTATYARGDRSAAVIDGKLIAVGQAVDSFKLASVTGRSAAFSGPHGRAVLNQIVR